MTGDEAGAAGTIAAAASPAAGAAAGYVLRCAACGAAYRDDGYALACEREHEAALLVTEYDRQDFAPDAGRSGLFRYASWLPARRDVAGAGGTVTYRSPALSRALGLPDLWLAFNGYWPERGATLETGTFKELEAYAVLARLPRRSGDVLVVSSAGNTAAAFARICSAAGLRCLIVVPEGALRAVASAGAVGDTVTVVSLRPPADYYDAIRLGDAVARIDGFVCEGGVRNVARRDGLGTVLLAATEAIGRLPDHYFQAVGSGAGAIAAYEAARRLVGDGRFGSALPRLMLSQNAPFAPIHEAWRAGRDDVVHEADDEARRRIRHLRADVLSNRRPPYATRGGLRDALRATGGDVLAASNAETAAAQRSFEQAEGVDLDPAGGVALASLAQAAASGAVERDATILLNLTGGGRRRLEADRALPSVRPALELTLAEVDRADTAARVAELVRGAPA